MNKDVLIEIALSGNYLNLSLCCKKFHRWIIENPDFWRRLIWKEFSYLDSSTNPKDDYKMLKKIQENPDYYYRKSIRKNEYEKQRLIEKVFSVRYPCIGIISKDDNYFSVMDVINLKTPISKEINLLYQGNLSIYIYCQTLGIPFIPGNIYYTISCIRKKLKNENQIYKVGDLI